MHHANEVWVQLPIGGDVKSVERNVHKALAACKSMQSSRLHLEIKALQPSNLKGGALRDAESKALCARNRHPKKVMQTARAVKREKKMKVVPRQV